MFDSQLLIPELKKIPSQNFCVAFSGGLDSLVLLDALVELTKDNYLALTQINAVHINHSWHSDADTWTQHCEIICQNYGVNFIAIKIDAKPIPTVSAEAHARELRYQALASVIKENDCLLTAHHQDDQAETFLLQLLRGAGVQGLAAMPFLTTFSQGYHARPLLNFSRQQLHEYAKKKNLQWIEDDSNLNTQYDRNYLRHEIMPLIKKRWPSAERVISRSANHCAQASKLLIQIAQQDLALVRTAEVNQLAIAELLKLDTVRRRHVLRLWLQQLNFPLPNKKHLEHIEHDVLLSRQDRHPLVKWKNVCVGRRKGYLYVVENVAPK